MHNKYISKVGVRQLYKGFKYRIYPNKRQTETINNTISLCRQLYNSALEHRILMYKNYKINVSRYAQDMEIKDIRKCFPEYTTVYAQVLKDVLNRLHKAYQNFFRRVKHGKKAGFPRFQSYRKYNSFTYPQHGFNLSDNHLQLAKIGSIKIKLHRPLEGIMKTCTIIRKNGRYYVCFFCETQPNTNTPLTHQGVGIDMGIKEFCITSNGEIFPNPKNYRKAEAKLKKQQRAVSRKKKGSNRRKKAASIVANTHEHIANQRKDNARKVASYLLNKYDYICREDLQIENMVKNHKLAKSISDAGWGIFFRALDAKAKQTLGKRVIIVDPRYTSQICSGCGEIVKKSLANRTHKCPCCGLEIDRDINAAINILNRGTA